MNKDLKKIIFRAVALGLGVATLVMNIVKTLEVKTAVTLLSFGLICLAVSEFNKDK